MEVRVEMAQAALALAVAFLQGVLKRVANATWQDLWEKIFEGVAVAEKKWEKESGKGSVKRQEVIDSVISWISEQRGLNFIERWIVGMLVGNVVDALIDEINKQLGKEWIKTATEVERRLADYIPIIT
jgi:hypothetical protein